MDRSSAGDGSGRTILIVVAAVAVVAIALFSVFRTVQSSQGRNMGSLGGIPGKSEAMKSQAAAPRGASPVSQDTGGKRGSADLSGAPSGSPGE